MRRFRNRREVPYKIRWQHYEYSVYLRWYIEMGNYYRRHANNVPTASIGGL